MKRAREILSDLLALAGAALVTQGAAILHPAAGFMVGGAFAIAAGFVLHRSAP